MTERPEQHENVEPEAPQEPAASAGEVPVARGATASYTTGTLQRGEVGPAVDKPEHEGATHGEGPVTPVQDQDADEFRESRVEGDVDRA